MVQRPLTHQQQSILMRALNPARVQQRSQGGTTLNYLEAWDIRATLIRVFGYGGFSSELLDYQIVDIRDVPKSRGDGTNSQVTVSARVRLTIHQLGAIYTEAAVSSQTHPVIGDAADFALKGLSLDTPLPTPDGWTTMGEVQVGDLVFDMDGLPTAVEMKSAVKHLPCYRVTFGDGRQIVCDEEHYWYAYRNGGVLRVHSITDLYKAKASGVPVSIPLAGPLHTADADLPVDPYTLGQWLGDGDRRSGRLTMNATDVHHALTKMDAGTVTPDPRSNAVSVRVVGLTTALRRAGILGQKVIPTEYLRASAVQRLALLAGLMDSDGTVSIGRPVFSTTSRVLAEQVAELVASLGDRPTISSTLTYGFGKEVTAYRVSWTPSLNPFTLPRKAEKVRLRLRRGVHRVRSIEKIESVPTQCIGVASPTRSYLAGEFMVPTHNTAESDALKRCAINLGTQYGLSLYSDGATTDVVRVVFAPGQEWPRPAETPKTPEPAPGMGHVAAPDEEKVAEPQLSDEPETPAPEPPPQDDMDRAEAIIKSAFSADKGGTK